MKPASLTAPTLLNSMAGGSQPLSAHQTANGKVLTQTPQQKVEGWLNASGQASSSVLPGQPSSPTQPAGNGATTSSQPALTNAALKLLNKTAKERIETFHNAIVDTEKLAGTFEPPESLVDMHHAYVIDHCANTIFCTH
jgi:hypothetical protein